MPSPEEAREFWQDIVYKDDGTLDEEQVMKELHDYMMMLEEVPRVYYDITGGALSKPHYLHASVMSAHESYLEQLFRDVRLEVVDAVFEMQRDGLTEDAIREEFENE